MSLGLFLFLVLTTTLTDGAGGWRVPVADDGKPCPFPIDPLLIFGAPLGQYHCGYCGSMILASAPHLDYSALGEDINGQ